MSKVNEIPTEQFAVQLVGADRLELNTAKPVYLPGPHQVLARVEAVGLCFSDMKLLHSFESHPRKGPIVSGIAPEVLREIPSYVPDALPTVPGHEVCVRIVAVGEAVTHFQVGDRYLVQADYRHLPTADNNAAFGYNFEGGLQEFVLLDERVIIGPDGESFLVPVPDEPSASSIALIEPWACVEDSYCTQERTGIKSGGRMLVVTDSSYPRADLVSISTLLTTHSHPAEIITVGLGGGPRSAMMKAAPSLSLSLKVCSSLEEVGSVHFDDIIYFGSSPSTIEVLDSLLGEGGLLNIVTGGKRIGQQVSLDVGRVHYAHTRFIGTFGTDVASSYAHIPATGEVRHGDVMLVVGAGGPMGTMHVIRALSMQDGPSKIIASDLSSERLTALARRVASATQNKESMVVLHNPTSDGPVSDQVDYVVLLAPVPALVSAAVRQLRQRGILNLFAGIKSGTKAPIDLDHYLENHLYMFGTSGSTVQDLHTVLDKVVRGELETNASVAAISGMRGAIEGLQGVNEQRYEGKVIVYPWLREMGLFPLNELARSYPEVAAKLKDGMWTKEAEEALRSLSEERTS